MVDWNSEAELKLETQVFVKFMHVLLGLYAWEWLISLEFDWDFVVGKKKFRWPIIFYFCGRYSLLFAMIGIAIALDVTSEINCQVLYTITQLLGNGSIGFASINLSIRTMAVWGQNLYIVIPLVILILGQWSLVLQGVLLKAAYVPGSGCAITHTNNTVLSATFIYTMCLDLIVMCLTAYKLVLGQKTARSMIVRRIWNDGLIYFLIAFLSNTLATTFMLLNLNSIMSVIFNVPSAVLSTIVACRAVRRLTNFQHSGPEVFSSSGQHMSRAYARATTQHGPPLASMSRKPGAEGVHVQMETFTVADDREFVVTKDEGSPYDIERSPEIGQV